MLFKTTVSAYNFISLCLVFLDLLLPSIAKLFTFFMLLFNSEMWKFYNTKHYITEVWHYSPIIVKSWWAQFCTCSRPFTLLELKLKSIKDKKFLHYLSHSEKNLPDSCSVNPPNWRLLHSALNFTPLHSKHSCSKTDCQFTKKHQWDFTGSLLWTGGQILLKVSAGVIQLYWSHVLLKLVARQNFRPAQSVTNQ